MTETELAEKDNTVRFAEAQADPMAAIESLGLTDAVDELEDRGYVVIAPERVASVEFVERIRDTVLKVAERRTGIRHALDTNGSSGRYKAEPQQPGQFLLYYLLFEDPVFEEWIMNPTLQALIAYRLRYQARLSSLSSFVKSKHGHYGEGLGLHADAPPCTTGRPVGG